MNFSAQNVFDYLKESDKRLEDVEIENFFVCPFELKDILSQADSIFVNDKAEYHLL